MTEEQWLASNDPRAMLRHLVREADTTSIDSGPWRQASTIRRPGVSDRKLRLFARACALAAGAQSLKAYGEEGERLIYPLQTVAQVWAGEGPPVPTEIRAALLRDIFGNPWRPVLVPVRSVPHPIVCDLICPWLTWNDGTVPKIARAIYDERRFEEMPILRDALIEAGCDNEEILRHCGCEEECVCELPIERPRHPNGLNTSCNQCRDGWRPLRGPHVRGCWVLDLLLGKE